MCIPADRYMIDGWPRTQGRRPRIDHNRSRCRNSRRIGLGGAAADLVGQGAGLAGGLGLAVGPEAPGELLVGVHGPCAVADGGEALHQPAQGALVVWLQGGGVARPPHHGARVALLLGTRGQRLGGLHGAAVEALPLLAEPPLPLAHPRQVEARQKGPPVKLQRRLRAPRLQLRLERRRVAPHGAGRHGHLLGAAPGDDLGAQRAAQEVECRAQRAPRPLRARLGPEQGEEGVAAVKGAAPGHQVHQEREPLGLGQDLPQLFALR
jgi:hypothetical protein